MGGQELSEVNDTLKKMRTSEIIPITCTYVSRLWSWSMERFIVPRPGV